MAKRFTLIFLIIFAMQSRPLYCKNQNIYGVPLAQSVILPHGTMVEHFVADGHFYLPMNKICSKCKMLKNESEFYFRPDLKHLLMSRCKQCILIDRTEHREKNIVRLKIKDINYHYKNREKRLLYASKYNQNNKIKKNEYFKNKYNSDLNFRIKTNIRNRIRMALKRNTKSATTNELIGCEICFLKTHLEKLFTDGMSWDNYGQWEVDHIIPCASFDFTIHEHQKKCFHYSNLQPLWKEDNMIKSNKIGSEVYHR